MGVTHWLPDEYQGNTFTRGYRELINLEITKPLILLVL